MEGRDVVAIAKTGSGKTCGFLLPGFMHIKNTRKDARYGPTVLVLAPTRELANQIQVEANKFGKFSGVRNTYVQTSIIRFMLRDGRFFCGLQCLWQAMPSGWEGSNLAFNETSAGLTLEACIKSKLSTVQFRYDAEEKPCQGKRLLVIRDAELDYSMCTACVDLRE